MSAFDCLLPNDSEKFCGSCKTVKFVDEFHSRDTSKDGKAYNCKDCVRVYNKKRYVDQREHAILYGLCTEFSCDAIIYFSSKLCETHYYKKTAFSRVGSSDHWNLLRDKAHEQKMLCAISGEGLIPGVNMSLDHIKPESVYPDSKNDVNNVQWVTKWVNVAKSNLDMDDFIKRCCNIVDRYYNGQRYYMDKTKET
tara:strand:- start:604 stop:1188 length:585 start_codon:yes stop_codon:yes gene_type:complete